MIFRAYSKRDIWRETGIYSTVGMSNSNPLLAKLALDNEAKHMATTESQLVPTKMLKLRFGTFSYDRPDLGDWKADGEAFKQVRDFLHSRTC